MVTEPVRDLVQVDDIGRVRIKQLTFQKRVPSLQENVPELERWIAGPSTLNVIDEELEARVRARGFSGDAK